ncbi:kinase-like domain-containing protein [Rhizophagus clarus]|uniref:Kinase-like domain-containing protein n=1 Tax=Rhizophagus clarus TaxID=94130 RepID=A0A8H3L4U8_9GLOM|nr:kinase-like domain-containing protein [Rhizophagus clarus]
MLVMKFASKGVLHNYLQKEFTEIKWFTKLEILWQISEGLKTIHDADVIHRDLHSGNILCDWSGWKIGDLGLSQPANNTSNNEIYGAIPYIAPEILNGYAFSKESDIYSMGMIMWELTTGCRPFANVKHDHSLIYKILDGLRPNITECFASLMRNCWDSNPQKGPSIKEIYQTFKNWQFCDKDAFNQAEAKRVELIKSKKLGPEFIEKSHSAIYTSRLLSVYTSKILFNDSFSFISFVDDKKSM